MKFSSSLQAMAFVVLLTSKVCVGDITAEASATVDENLITPPLDLKSSQLLEGVMIGDPDMVIKAIKDGEHIDDCNVNGWSAALFAVAHSDMHILELLISEEIDLNLPADDGMTALMLAASQGNKEMVDLMLLHNADPTMINIRNETARDLADVSGRKIISMAITEATVLYRLHGEMASHSSHIVTGVKEGAYVNLQSTGGWTPIIFAASLGHTKEVGELIELGADVNHVESEGWSALHFAAQNGHTETCDLLLKNKCSLEENDEGLTPRHLAEAAGYTEIVSMFDLATVDL